MKLHELLDMIKATYDDVDLRYYKLVTGDRKEGELYNVRGVWLDHEQRTISFSLTRSKPRKTIKKANV